MSYRLFIHQNVLETLERLCGAARETYPDDPIVQTAEFRMLAPPPQDAKQKQSTSIFARLVVIADD